MLHRPVLAFAILASATTFGARAETAEERQACTNDAQTHCPDEIPDRERVYGCLVKKVNQLSPPCKKIISSTLAPARSKR
jgi:cysteine rich repeat protein